MVIGKFLLNALGLGQKDLLNVFSKTIDKLSVLDNDLSPRERSGAALAISTVFDVLESEDVMEHVTREELAKKLVKWHDSAKRPAPKKKPEPEKKEG